MKKLLSVILAAALILCMGITAGAVPNNFVESPSALACPEIVSYHNDDETCDGMLVIKSYGQKDELPEAEKDEFVFAYGEIVSAEALTDLTAGLEVLAQKMGISSENLAVADLFYIYMVKCHTHNVVDTTTIVETEFKPNDNCKVSFLAKYPEKEELEVNPEFEAALAKAKDYLVKNMAITDKIVTADHGNLNVEIKSDNLDHFVGLMNYTNGEWSVIENAKINERGNLQYSSHKLGAFAIVVNNTSANNGQKDIDNPSTGDFLPYLIYVVFALAASCALIVFLVLTRKRKHS